ncbi:hypothetical protein ACFULT_22135 [Rhodococcus sp. NPDC057297]|uniref:hypothetical protein n=1 Tax=Rhodococcus sp. NPDC057297 TaxID=3346090 RepID=UPI003624B92E
MPYEIGTIDPDTAEYTKYAELGGRTFQEGPGTALSPDLTRLAARKTEADGTELAGWYDLDGTFVPGGPEIVNGKFAQAQHFESIRFDYQGRLNYAVKTEGTIDYRYFVVDPDTQQSTQINSSGGYGVQFLPDGTYAQPESCYHEVYSFTPTNKALFVDYGEATDSQIYLADFASLPSIGSCGPTGQALLPETNPTQVAQPVMTRDQQSVAFLLGRPNNLELYTVDLAGGEPKEVPGDWSDFTLMEWRG